MESIWIEYYVQYKENEFNWLNYKDFSYANLDQAIEVKNRLQTRYTNHQFRVTKKIVEIEVVE